MNINPEAPTLTQEQRDQTESRIVSDAGLIEGGAKIRADSSLEVTKKQIEQAKEESEGSYIEKTIVNGVLVVVGKVEGHEFYAVGVAKEPDPEIIDTMNIGRFLNWSTLTTSFNAPDREFAKKVYDYACSTAKENNDVVQLYKKIRDFANENDPEES